MSLFNSYASHDANEAAVHSSMELSLQVNAARSGSGLSDRPVALGVPFINCDGVDDNSGAHGSKVPIGNKMNSDTTVIGVTGEADVIVVTHNAQRWLRPATRTCRPG
jgi:hypothetical protein